MAISYIGVLRFLFCFSTVQYFPFLFYIFPLCQIQACDYAIVLVLIVVTVVIVTCFHHRKAGYI